jgi:F-type H+-transporting ATPase subunit epsilon
MSKTFKLQVVAPDCPAILEEATLVVLPGEMGEFGVMAGHVPFLSTLKPGVMRVVKDGERKLFFLAGGFVEVNASSVIVLAEAYESSEEIDLEAAQGALTKAQGQVSQPEIAEVEVAKQALARAVARVKVAEEAKTLKR